MHEDSVFIFDVRNVFAVLCFLAWLDEGAERGGES